MLFSKLRSYQPSHGTVVAYIALFVALGGTGYAAATIGSSQIKNNSVRSKDLRNNDVRSKDLRNNDVRSKDVRNHSLLAKDFKSGQLPAGPRGPAGAPATTLWAQIAADRSIVRSSQPGFSTSGGLDQTNVIFPRSITRCSFAATIAALTSDAAYPIGTLKISEPTAAQPRQVSVITTTDYNGSGSESDARGFYIQAFC